MVDPQAVQAIAVDVDGTLIGPDHVVTPRTRTAVVALRAAGVRVVLASARYPPAMQQFASELELAGEPVVTCQGAVWGTWGDDGSLVDWAARPIGAEAALAATRMGRDLGLWVSWYTPTHWFVEAGDRMAGQEEEITATVATRLASWADAGQAPAKMCLMAEPGDLDLIAVAQARLPADVAGAVSRPDYLEVAARGVTKWGGVLAALAPLGIDPTHTAAIGDGENDLQMIEGAAIGIAMGNASDRVKQAADWVAPPNDADGFATAVDWLLRHRDAAGDS